MSAKIPVNKQQFTAVGGVDIIHLKSNVEQPEAFEDHRDEYFVLLVVVKGCGLLRCDLGNIPVLPGSTVLIKPYQVHSGDLEDENSECYFISIEPFLIPELCKEVFDNLEISEQGKQLTSGDMDALMKIVVPLYNAFNADSAYKVQIQSTS